MDAEPIEASLIRTRRDIKSFGFRGHWSCRASAEDKPAAGEVGRNEKRAPEKCVSSEARMRLFLNFSLSALLAIAVD